MAQLRVVDPRFVVGRAIRKSLNVVTFLVVVCFVIDLIVWYFYLGQRDVGEPHLGSNVALGVMLLLCGLLAVFDPQVSTLPRVLIAIFVFVGVVGVYADLFFRESSSDVHASEHLSKIDAVYL